MTEVGVVSPFKWPTRGASDYTYDEESGGREQGAIDEQPGLSSLPKRGKANYRPEFSRMQGKSQKLEGQNLHSAEGVCVQE